MALMDRVPPQNIEAEQSVLGSMLLDRNALIAATEILEAGAFYHDSHRVIFQAMIDLYNRAEPVDTVTLCEELRSHHQLEGVGGASYIAELSNAVPTAANVEYYARIVHEKSVLRRMLEASATIAKEVYDSEDEVDVLLDRAEKAIFDIAERRGEKQYAGLRDILVETFEHIEMLHSQKGEVVGVPTGFKDLDRMTSGFHPAELIILAARPSQGKTTLCLNIAMHAALEAKVPVALFSLEMAKVQLAQRLLCAEANVNAHRLRTGYLRDEDWPRLSRAFGRLSEAPIYIDDSPNLSIMEVRARARRMKSEHDIGLVVIDYLQLMHVKGRAENRQQEISEISRGLKALARELNAPVLALSQLNRQVEQRQDHRPQLSDLRESGAIEQDADLVSFIYHNPERENDSLVDIVVAKQRNGPTGSVQLVFLKEIGRFVNLDRVHGDQVEESGTM